MNTLTLSPSHLRSLRQHIYDKSLLTEREGLFESMYRKADVLDLIYSKPGPLYKTINLSCQDVGAKMTQVYYD